MNKQDDDNPAVIADLPVDEAKQDEVNGGEVQGDLGKTYSIEDLNAQDAEASKVKGGIKIQDCLIANFQTSGHGGDV